MLEKVRQNIRKLIAAYEAEKMERTRLQSALDQVLAQNEAYRKQITELERQIDNLKLAEAFKADGTGSPEAKKKINSLLKEIDRCITLLEG
jgi:phage shock protein A